MLEHRCLQGEAYEEDDSCAAIDHAELQQDMNSEEHHFAQAAGMHVGASNGLEWQQKYDSTTGYFYYYKESTEVRTSTNEMCCTFAWIGTQRDTKGTSHSLPAPSPCWYLHYARTSFSCDVSFRSHSGNPQRRATYWPRNTGGYASRQNGLPLRM